MYIDQVCKNNNIVLICDEVQCGMGRTGTMWNFEQKGCTPDILTFGKGIAGGFPLAGLIGSEEIMNFTEEGYLGGTYGGNPLCCTAASATLDVFEKENILDNVNLQGTYIYDSLVNLPYIKTIRKHGLMIAIEFYNDNMALEICNKLRDRGILVLLAGNKNQYVRLLPPLNIKRHEIDIFLKEMILLEV